MKLRKWLWRSGLGTLFCLMAACLLLFGDVPALAARAAGTTAPPQGKVQSSKVVPHEQGMAATRYWSSTRFQDARLAELAPQHLASKQETAPVATGKPNLQQPAVPSRLKQASVDAPGVRALRNQPQDYSYPFPYWRFEIGANYTSWPYSTFGKVFFTDSRTGINYVCSGTAVNGNNGSVVDTAGHCVVQGGSGSNWYTNWVFCPAYIDGTCPLGVWSARQLWSYSFWSSNGQLEYDLGAAVVNQNNGRTLVNTVGGEGEAWNYSRSQYFSAFGYPQADPFTGQRLIECFAPHATDQNPDGFSGFFGPYTMGIGCDMTGGSSGGGWLIYFGNGGGYVNGHNDYRPTNQPQAMYSPYYGDAAHAVFNGAQNS